METEVVRKNTKKKKKVDLKVKMTSLEQCLTMTTMKIIERVEVEAVEGDAVHPIPLLQSLVEGGQAVRIPLLAVALVGWAHPLELSVMASPVL